MTQTEGATDVVRALHRAYNERDRDGVLACLAEDVRWHMAGDHPLAGTYEGHKALWEDLLQPLWPSPAKVEEHEVVAHGDHVVSFGAEVHDFGEGGRAWNTVEVFEVRDGRVVQRWAFTSGQAELDAFLTRGCAAAGEPSMSAP